MCYHLRVAFSGHIPHGPDVLTIPNDCGELGSFMPKKKDQQVSPSRLHACSCAHCCV